MLLEDPASISEEIVSYYSSLYKDLFAWRPLLDDLPFDSIFGIEAKWLERPFDEDEVAGVIWGFSGDKAPDLNGFTLTFFQSCLEVVRGDVLLMFNEFVQHGKFVRSLNAIFIILIPKKSGAVRLKDFRPISLVGGVYKILARRWLID